MIDEDAGGASEAWDRQLKKQGQTIEEQSQTIEEQGRTIEEQSGIIQERDKALELSARRIAELERELSEKLG